MLNVSVHPDAGSEFGGVIAFYVFVVILLNLIPIFLNVVFSFIVFFEVNITCFLFVLLIKIVILLLV